MNRNLTIAKKNKNDEFYTRYEDVKLELDNYKDKFKDKVILCNCNDKGSSFEKYFTENDLEIKDLIVTEGRFQDNIEALKKCDIVVTNPPFSQFREFIDLLIGYDKDFIVIGSNNAITYKNIFPLIQKRKIFLGINKPKIFLNSDKNVFTYWYTTFETTRPKLNLKEIYTPEKYPKYDNYDAIEVSKIKDIPKDYDDVMGVPITFIDKWNKEQFEILGFSHGKLGRKLGIKKDITKRVRLQIKNENGYKLLYPRILIKRKIC